MEKLKTRINKEIESEPVPFLVQVYRDQLKELESLESVQKAKLSGHLELHVKCPAEVRSDIEYWFKKFFEFNENILTCIKSVLDQVAMLRNTILDNDTKVKGLVLAAINKLTLVFIWIYHKDFYNSDEMYTDIINDEMKNVKVGPEDCLEDSLEDEDEDSLEDVGQDSLEDEDEKDMRLIANLKLEVSRVRKLWRYIKAERDCCSKYLSYFSPASISGLSHETTRYVCYSMMRQLETLIDEDGYLECFVILLSLIHI